MPFLIPPPPRLTAAEREVFQHHIGVVEDAAIDPESYFGQDAEPGYADSREMQIADFLERLDLQSYGGAGDHRWANAAARTAAKCRKAWGVE